MVTLRRSLVSVMVAPAGSVGRLKRISAALFLLVPADSSPTTVTVVALPRFTIEFADRISVSPLLARTLAVCVRAPTFIDEVINTQAAIANVTAMTLLTRLNGHKIATRFTDRPPH